MLAASSELFRWRLFWWRPEDDGLEGWSETTSGEPAPAPVTDRGQPVAASVRQGLRSVVFVLLRSRPGTGPDAT